MFSRYNVCKAHDGAPGGKVITRVIMALPLGPRTSVQHSLADVGVDTHCKYTINIKQSVKVFNQ